MLRACSPHIIKCFGTTKLPTATPNLPKGFNDGAFAMLLEWMEAGSMARMVLKHMTGASRLYSDKEALELLLDIASGILYLHSQSPPVIHRDLKLVRGTRITPASITNHTTRTMTAEVAAGVRAEHKALGLVTNMHEALLQVFIVHPSASSSVFASRQPILLVVAAGESVADQKARSSGVQTRRPGPARCECSQFMGTHFPH